jgi:hypothetical protein
MSSSHFLSFKVFKLYRVLVSPCTFNSMHAYAIHVELDNLEAFLSIPITFLLML